MILGMKPERTDRTPIFLSAFVYPGAGQFLQGRWKAGLFFSLCFTTCLVLFIVNVAGPILRSLDAALSWAGGGKSEEFVPVSIARLMITFASALTLYISSIADVARAVRRRQHELSTQRREDAEPRQGD
jgi:hypothetical protein